MPYVFILTSVGAFHLCQRKRAVMEASPGRPARCNSSASGAFQRKQSTSRRIPMARSGHLFYSGNMRLELHLVTKTEHLRPLYGLAASNKKTT
jgi:hypothetical protein